MKLIQFTDCHIQRERPTEQQFSVQPFWGGDPLVLFERLGQLANDADAIIFSGDASHGGAADDVDLFFELLEVAARGKPVFMVLGNHDVADGPGNNHFMQAVRKYPNVQIREEIFSIAGVDLLLINNGYRAADGCVSGFWRTESFPVPAIQEPQVARVNELLSMDSSRPAIVVVHCPTHVIPAVPFDFGTGVFVGMDQYRKMLHDVLDQHPRVRRVLSGHVHFTSTQRFAHGRMQQSLGSFIEYPYQVRIIEGSPSDLQSRVVNLAQIGDLEGAG